ncbi:MAG: SDR family NAD(P)-dependent oxidoreductase [Lentisphaeraceae bacterium]|nr:SDR family NAD(P)-dependent oxidoreductase [Lentisphaeraceae bacterium]
MRILVTGGARRLGRFFVKSLAAEGHQMAIHYNTSSAQAEEVLAEVGGKDKGHRIFQTDLSNLKEAEKLIPTCVADGEPLDLLINCASTFHCRGMSGINSDDLLQDITINFMSPFLLMQQFNLHCPSGQIINILDRRVNLVDAAAGPYALAKKSLRDATQACAQEWLNKTRVNAIAPGNVLNPGLEIGNDVDKKIAAILTAINGFMNSSETGIIREV